MNRILAISTAMIMLAGLLAGCQNPELEARWDQREDNLARTVAVIEKIESRRDDRLARTLAMLDEMYQRDVYNTARQEDRINQWWADQEEQWRRKQVYYDRIITDQLDGDVPNIERTLPLILQ